jgi:hypothetical protein
MKNRGRMDIVSQILEAATAKMMMKAAAVLGLVEQKLRIKHF